MLPEQFRKIYFHPIFNYEEFLDEGKLTDCTIVVSEGVEKKAHCLILANSSEFFFNAFTSGMEEEKQRRVKITENTNDTFIDILKWIYSGKIIINDENVMALLHMARFYGVSNLTSVVENWLKQFITGDSFNIEKTKKYIEQCYTSNLSTELEYLTPFIAEHFDEFEIDYLSNQLDVKIFAKIMNLTSFPIDRKIEIVTEFLGDYALEDEEEKAALLSIIESHKNDKSFRVLITKNKPSWIPSDF